MKGLLRKLGPVCIGSLKGKVFLLLALCAAIAVLTTGGTAAYLNLRANQGAARDEVIRETEILAQFSEVVLAFEGLGSPEDLETSFKALTRDRHVMAMAVYRADGSVFATHTRADVTDFTPPPFDTNSLRVTERWLECQRPVYSGNRLVGGAFLRHDTDEITERFADFVESGLLAVGISFGAALILASLLGRFVSRPVETLAEIATRVGEQKDYSLRATRASNDEIGRLVDQFNRMLEQIESQDHELRQAHDELEDRVDRRTRELADSERNLRETLEGIPIPVGIYRADGNFEYFNSTFTSAFGYELADLPDLKSWWPRLHPKSEEQLTAREEWTRHVADAVRSDGDILPLSTRIATREGAAVEVNVWGRVMGDRIVMLLNDVTEEKKRQEALARARDEAEAANRAKSEFLSRMSHELRTPLNGIIGFSKLLEMARLPDRAARNVTRIHEAGLHLLELINEVLDISRIEAGEFSLSREGIELDDVIRDVIGLVEPMARERRIRVQHNESAPAGLLVSADRQRLRQVLLNLASNGIKYNRDEGEINFTVKAVGTDRVRVELRDTGHGIPPEKLTRLFTPFDRLDAERTHTQIEGTGLGLSLSKKLVEAMGGTITVTSSVGEGSVFAVELDRSAVDTGSTPDPDTPADEARETTPAASAELGILYIEDNPDNLALVEQVVEHCPGVRLLTAIQGGQGLDLARDHRPDMIFLDFHLPDLNGDDVLKRLKQGERTRDIPVYMLSADAMSTQIHRLKELGAADYLTKPLDIDLFLDLLSKKGQEKNSAHTA